MSNFRTYSYPEVEGNILRPDGSRFSALMTEEVIVAILIQLILERESRLNYQATLDEDETNSGEADDRYGDNSYCVKLSDN